LIRLVAGVVSGYPSADPRAARYQRGGENSSGQVPPVAASSGLHRALFYAGLAGPLYTYRPIPAGGARGRLARASTDPELPVLPSSATLRAPLTRFSQANSTHVVEEVAFQSRLPRSPSRISRHWSLVLYTLTGVKMASRLPAFPRFVFTVFEPISL